MIGHGKPRHTFLLTAALCAGTMCAPYQPSTTEAPITVANARTVPVAPASDHITGTYPASCHRAPGDNPKLPVWACTPGSIRSDMVNSTDAQLAVTICHPGWTATVRPSVSETEHVKTIAMIAYGVSPSERAITELDHKIPLELGGSNDVSNLWPEVSDEPGHGFRNTKDTVENDLRRAVCTHRVSLVDAQAAIATDWTTAERALGMGA